MSKIKNEILLTKKFEIFRNELHSIYTYDENASYYLNINFQ